MAEIEIIETKARVGGVYGRTHPPPQQALRVYGVYRQFIKSIIAHRVSLRNS